LIALKNPGYPLFAPNVRDVAVENAWLNGDGKSVYQRMSFFGLFYGDYRIIALDEKDHLHSVIANSRRDYLWILSRTKTMDPVAYYLRVTIAYNAGFDSM
jgi:apolipoprotein D and lipocalin family protein